MMRYGLLIYAGTASAEASLIISDVIYLIVPLEKEKHTLLSSYLMDT